MSGAASLFRRDGDLVVPTDLARGPWRPDALHGAAVAAVLACGIDVPGWTPVRVTFDLLAPVRAVPMTLRASAPEGGRRVVRQTVTLLDGDRPVARAQCLAVRRADLDLPDGVTDHPDPFAGARVPDLSEPTRGAREAVGWDCFDASAVSVSGLRSSALEPGTVGLWVRLLVPVFAGEPTPGIARAAAAADYASTATNARLPFEEWSFMNAELSLHVSREPSGPWIGLVGAGLVQPIGSGISVAALYDSAGRLGQSAQALVVEARQPVA
ncbi:acyl-CoA thioesterase domain-containing protein [Actinocorallia sp. A-T 12471]|uniref:acyl-CoA thioesterase domain-containing protein n=1 Tax=Actinocorallia sp. A-T 12471 TaxID=3089813 RepID=UPI0029CBD1D6|nr:acyl-CoA thioesterase domain-containing protein [Actinocorallia sp. A-T 12471]MDX6740834.1 thioesterase family protein [Actinocorallia sp. A-T 12471]